MTCLLALEAASLSPAQGEGQEDDEEAGFAAAASEGIPWSFTPNPGKPLSLA